MAYTETFFTILPTPEEKQSRGRKYNLMKAGLNAAEPMEELSKKYFKPQTSKALCDPLRCVLQLQKIMTSTSHMENLSDFVAICFAFTYQNYQSQPQSIGLLRHCLNNNFKFDEPELDLLIQVMVNEPPQSSNDMKFCSQIVALICKQSLYCAKLFIQRFQQDKMSESQAQFMSAIAKEICLEPTNFSQSEIEILKRPLVADPSLKKKKKIKDTPTVRRMEQVEIKTKVNSVYSRIKNYQTLLFIILTIFLVLAIISIL